MVIDRTWPYSFSTCEKQKVISVGQIESRAIHLRRCRSLDLTINFAILDAAFKQFYDVLILCGKVGKNKCEFTISSKFDSSKHSYCCIIYMMTKTHNSSSRWIIFASTGDRPTGVGLNWARLFHTFNHWITSHFIIVYVVVLLIFQRKFNSETKIIKKSKEAREVSVRW